MKQILLTALLSVGLGLHAFGGLYSSQTFNSGFQNSGVIPDGSLNGLTDTRTVSGAAGTWQVDSVIVTLNVSGGYNGDLYAYLAHGSGTAVLLNRVGIGSTYGDAFGAAGSGLGSLILSSTVANNIHFNLGSGTTGTFEPDGRTISPLSASSAFDSTPSGNALTTFNGMDPNGSWTLFFADTVTSGSSPTLTSWSLAITAVPEPVNMALGIFAGVFVLGGLGRTQRVRDQLRRWRFAAARWVDSV